MKLSQSCAQWGSFDPSLGEDRVSEGEPLLRSHFSFSHFQPKPSSFYAALEACVLAAFLTVSPRPPQAPHFPPGSDLLLKAASVYHSFLTWPVPYCDIFRELLTFISNELKAPGKHSCPAVGFSHAAGPASPKTLTAMSAPCLFLRLSWCCCLIPYLLHESLERDVHVYLVHPSFSRR